MYRSGPRHQSSKSGHPSAKEHAKGVKKRLTDVYAIQVTSFAESQGVQLPNDVDAEMLACRRTTLTVEDLGCEAETSQILSACGDQAQNWVSDEPGIRKAYSSSPTRDLSGARMRKGRQLIFMDLTRKEKRSPSRFLVKGICGLTNEINTSGRQRRPLPPVR